MRWLARTTDQVVAQGRSRGAVQAAEQKLPRAIGIMGPWVGNLGDAAIQQSMLQRIHRCFPVVQIRGFALHPGEAERRHGVPSYPIGNATVTGWSESDARSGKAGLYLKLLRRLRASSNPRLRSLSRWLARVPVELGLILQAYNNLRGLDYLIISGGGQLDDYWGGAWDHPYTLFKFGLLARLCGAKLLIVSVGAGPINARLSQYFIRGALALASYRSFRDQASKNLIARIGFRRSDDPVYPDLAHSLAIEPYLAASADAPAARRPLVGIGPMSYFDPRVWPERDSQVYQRYLAKLADLMLWMLGQDHDVLLFTGEVYDDRRVISDLRGLLGARGIALDDTRILEPVIDTVDDLMAHLARVDVAIASRFHGVLLAQLVNKPVLALSYHPKIDALMEDMGQASYCLPIDSFDPELAKERFAAMWANRQQIRQTMAERTRAYREALDAQYRAIFGPH